MSKKGKSSQPVTMGKQKDNTKGVIKVGTINSTELLLKSRGYEPNQVGAGIHGGGKKQQSKKNRRNAKQDLKKQGY